MTGLTRAFLMVVAALTLSVSLTACGDTWEGVKEDTGDNLRATGRAVEGAGEQVQ